MMSSSAPCTNFQTIGHRCSDHGGREQSDHDLEMMIHNENQKGLRYVIVNFTPSYVEQLSDMNIANHPEQMGKS